MTATSDEMLLFAGTGEGTRKPPDALFPSNRPSAGKEQMTMLEHQDRRQTDRPQTRCPVFPESVEGRLDNRDNHRGGSIFPESISAQRLLSRSGGPAANLRGFPAQSVAGYAAKPVFLPGLFETPHVWQDIKVRLGVPDAMCLDLPGHVATAAAHEDEMSLRDGVEVEDWIDKAADRIGEAYRDEGVVLIGHSTGSLLALALSARHPERVSGLAAVGGLTNGKRGRRYDPYAGMMKIPGIGRSLGRAFWSAWLSSPARFRRGLASAAGVELDTAWAEDMRKALSGCDPDAIRTFAEWVLAADIEHLLEKVDVPILSIIGTRDRVVSPRHQLRLLRKAPNAQAMLLDGGHLLFAEHPDPVVVALEAWLRHCAGSRPGVPA